MRRLNFFDRHVVKEDWQKCHEGHDIVCMVACQAAAEALAKHAGTSLDVRLLGLFEVAFDPKEGSDVHPGIQRLNATLRQRLRSTKSA